jgi:hypothetical protein
MKAREQVRRHLAHLELHRLAVKIAASPAGVVASGYRYVCVAELLRDVSERDTRSQELGGEGISQIL